MKKLFIVIGLILVTDAVIFAQANPFMTDANSRPLYMRVNYVPDGSPYLFEEYALAEITLDNNKVYPYIKAKFNLVDKELVYMDDNGNEMVATSAVKSIRFFSGVVNGLKQGEIKLESPGKALNTKDATTYIAMVDGRAGLLKQISVNFTDDKKYGQATITRTFRRKETNYAYFPGKSPEFEKVEKNKSSIIGLFSDRIAEMTSFIEKNQLKCKSDEDLVRIFQHYNNL